MEKTKAQQIFEKNLFKIKKLRNLEGFNQYVIKSNKTYLKKDNNETETILEAKLFQSGYLANEYIKDKNIQGFKAVLLEIQDIEKEIKIRMKQNEKYLEILKKY